MTKTVSGHETGLGMPASNEIFENHQNAVFWIGKVALGTEVILPDYYDSLLKFRGKWYVNELHYLTEDQIDTFGRESDLDDKRSVHFAVVENDQIDNNTQARVIGSGRVISKTSWDEPLPVEQYFPEIFNKRPLEPGSVEVSRFIARHEDRQTQHIVALALIRAMTHYSVESKVRADYCIIEEPLLNLLTSIGIPVEKLAEPKDIPEYGGQLYPVRINPYEILDSVKHDMSGTIALKRFFKEEVPNQGIGFYPKSFTGVTND